MMTAATSRAPKKARSSQRNWPVHTSKQILHDGCMMVALCCGGSSNVWNIEYKSHSECAHTYPLVTTWCGGVCGPRRNTAKAAAPVGVACVTRLCLKSISVRSAARQHLSTNPSQSAQHTHPLLTCSTAPHSDSHVSSLSSSSPPPRPPNGCHESRNRHVLHRPRPTPPPDGPDHLRSSVTSGLDMVEILACLKDS